MLRSCVCVCLRVCTSSGAVISDVGHLLAKQQESRVVCLDITRRHAAMDVNQQ